MQLGAMNDPRRDLFAEIAWIAESGFDYIDLTIEAPGCGTERNDWRQVQQAIADHGLGVVCHSAPYLPIDNPSPLVRQAAVNELRRSIDVAHVVGAPLCTMTFLGWPAYLSDSDGYEFYRQLLEILVKHGAERNVQVAMQNQARNEHQLKCFREIFHRVPALRLLLDVGHVNIKTARSLTRDYLFALADRLAHVHLSDNDGLSDLHLPPGAPQRGGIDLRRELRDLRSFHYDGTITLDVLGERRWLLASASLVRELWKEVT